MCFFFLIIGCIHALPGIGQAHLSPNGPSPSFSVLHVPAFQGAQGVYIVDLVCSIEKLGMGLGTRLKYGPGERLVNSLKDTVFLISRHIE